MRVEPGATGDVRATRVERDGHLTGEHIAEVSASWAVRSLLTGQVVAKPFTGWARATGNLGGDDRTSWRLSQSDADARVRELTVLDCRP